MKKQEFDKLKKLPNYIVFYGNEFYLDLYEKKLLKRFENASILRMYFDEYNYEEAKLHLSENSLFGDTNILILKNNKIPQNFDKLIKYINNSYLLFFYYGNKLPNYVKNFVRFFEPDLKELIYFIDEKVKNLNVTITKEAKLKLIQMVEPIFIEKELEKLSNYTSEITSQDIEELVFSYKEDTFESVIVSILKGEDFENSLKNLLIKTDYKRFLSAIIRYIKELYKYNLYIKKTGLSSLKGLLGYQLPFKIEKQRVELAIKIKEKDFYELLKFLLNAELKIRKGSSNSEAVFWEIVTFLKTFNSF